MLKKQIIFMTFYMLNQIQLKKYMLWINKMSVIQKDSLIKKQKPTTMNVMLLYYFIIITINLIMCMNSYRQYINKTQHSS